MLKGSLLISTIMASAVLLPGAAAAQDGDEALPDNTASHIVHEERDAIIVTARKRNETLQDVPIIANVMTGQALEQANISDFEALATRVPSLVLGSTPGSLGPQVALRGIGPSSPSPTNDQSVSLNIDGVPMSQGWAYKSGVFDVAQVEVLKGPQSLFFGKNNTAGVISFRTADPTDEFEVIGRVGHELEATETTAELIISGPVTDSFGLRLAAQYSDKEGYFRNRAVATPGLGGRTPDYRNYGPTEAGLVRGTALFEPNDQFSARFKLSHQRSRMEGGSAGQQAVYCPEGTGGVAPTNIGFIENDDCKADRNLNLVWFDPDYFPNMVNGGVPFHNLDQTIGSLELNFYPTDDILLTSVTGFSRLKSYNMNLGGATGTTSALAAIIDFRDRQITQEFRVTSEFDSPLNFMVGAFYQNAEQTNKVRLPSNSALGLGGTLQHLKHEVDIESVSAFGQLLWDILPNLELSAGARWTHEERDHTQINYNPPQGPIGPTFRPDPHLSSNNVSPEVTLSYKPTDTLMLFASYRTGFKSGSFSTANFQPATTLSSYGDEEAHGFEAGLKYESFDQSFGAGLAVYDYQYEDLQVGANELSAIGGGNFVAVNRTLNAASATVRGVEVDAHYSPPAVPGLTLTVTGNYNDAHYDSFPNAPCGNGQTRAQGCNQLFNPSTGLYTAQDMSGRRLVRAPKWTGFAGLDQVFSLNNGMRINLGAGVNYSSSYSTELTDLPGFQQSPYAKFNANIGIHGPDDRWEVSLIGQNLGDELTRGQCTDSNLQNGAVFGGQITGGTTSGPAGRGEAACTLERGREVWLRLSYKLR